MPVFTVHEPPPRAGDALPDSGRFVFVRDGFSFWAFLAASLWMLWHRMWLVLVGYVIISVAVISLLAALGASHTALVLVGLLISILVGLEASTLRRFTLRRRGWRNIGIVSGDDLEDAERRFFDAWLRGTPSRRAPSVMPAPAAPAAMPRVTQPPGVIGLFPEPGGRR